MGVALLIFARAGHFPHRAARATLALAPTPTVALTLAPLAVQGTLDNINLFSCITIISFFLLLPVALLTEGVRFTPAAMRAAGLVPSVVMKQAILAAVCFHAYQQVWICYAGLQCAGPVTTTNRNLHHQMRAP